MPCKPAARLGDPTAHGSPLAPGPCSFDVLIGNKPAWRGLSPAMVGQLLEKAADVAKSAAKASVSSLALKEMKDGIEDMMKIMGSTDQHACPIVKVVVPDGNGVVINGSPTVLINNLPACRMGDTLQEATSVNTIAFGEPTVLIGGSAQAGAMGAAKNAGAPFCEKCKG